jgi:uncharacterized protein
MSKSEIIIIPFKENNLNSYNINQKYLNNWPVLYLIFGNNEFYVGETLSVESRINQHKKTKYKYNLTNVAFVFDGTFNKSVTLDFENRLITYLSGLTHEGFKLLNNNFGQSSEHNYYDREKYNYKFPEIWNKLLQLKIVTKTLIDIENFNEFKYSPFKSLNDEQTEIINDILHKITRLKNNEKYTFIISGGAGTGKSLLAIKLAKIFSEKNRIKPNNYDFLEKVNYTYDELYDYLSTMEISKVEFALAIPMANFRKTISEVFQSIGNGLSSKQVISPYSKLFEKYYDILIVDEAHRLKSGEYLSQEQGNFIKINKVFNKSEKLNQLQWILKQSRIQILFYDETQTVRSSDISRSEFHKLMSKENVYTYTLTSQFRVNAGGDFIKYIDDIFSNNPPKVKLSFKNYDIRIFDSIDDFKTNLHLLDKNIGLSKIVSGYSWPWLTKNDSKLQFDFKIDNQEFIWNKTWRGWISSETADNEVGCIHTTQGFDLNYVGLIVGNDIQVNPVTYSIEVNLNNFYDIGSIKGIKNKPNESKKFVINAYKTMMKRGIRGLYLYIVDTEVKEFFKKYF